jgi:beta-xylosidase
MTTETDRRAELPWVADNGDGTYRNPVLHADWSDPDVIRVGADFYLVASSFHRAPGLPVLHSRDLVNWTILGHALPRLEPEGTFATPRPGCGVWAPSIRYHDGRFQIFYPDPDHGIFVVTAADPAGPWSRPHPLKTGRGLIDPCPLWDDDGTAYLVHAWARSRAGINNRLTCHRMSPDASELLDDGAVIIDGDTLPGYRTLEGPKCYRRDGWYWIFAPAGGVVDGWQSVFRSRRMTGPYADRVVLAQGGTPVNGPHQGAWVTTDSGEDWFLHFQSKGAFGRVVHLQPMRWNDHGWPVIGRPGPDGVGTPVLTHTKPTTVAGRLPAAPATSDAFTGPELGPQWTWAANPDPAWWQVRDGLRLRCVPSRYATDNATDNTADNTADLRLLPNLLGQRLPADRFRAVTSLRLVGAPVGARAGLTVLGASYAWIGLERTPDGTVLVYRTAAAERGEVNGSEPVPVPTASDGRSPAVTLGVDVDTDGRCRFFTDAGHGTCVPVGAPFTATPGAWVGATLGLFATAPPAGRATGSAELTALRVAPLADGRL